MSIDTNAIIKGVEYQLNTSADELGEAGSESQIRMPGELDPSIVINEQYLRQFKTTKNFKVFRVKTDFFPLEKRHLGAKKDELISSFHEVMNGTWACAFKESQPNVFGFIPMSYLELEHVTNSQNVTPTSKKSNTSMVLPPQKQPSMTRLNISPNTQERMYGNAVEQFLQGIYDSASRLI